MTDLQMVLIIGIPTLSVLVAMWRSDKRIDDLAERLDDKIDSGFSKMDQRFDLIEAENRFFHGTIGEHKEAIAILKRKAGL